MKLNSSIKLKIFPWSQGHYLFGYFSFLNKNEYTWVHSKDYEAQPYFGSYHWAHERSSYRRLGFDIERNHEPTKNDKQSTSHLLGRQIIQPWSNHVTYQTKKESHDWYTVFSYGLNPTRFGRSDKMGRPV